MDPIEMQFILDIDRARASRAGAEARTAEAHRDMQRDAIVEGRRTEHVRGFEAAAMEAAMSRSERLDYYQDLTDAATDRHDNPYR